MKTENVEKIIVHCSATREGDDSVNVEVIDRWHKARGWRGCGYHFVVLMDGKIEVGRKLNECGAHTKGINCKSWGVSQSRSNASFCFSVLVSLGVLPSFSTPPT